MTSKVGNPSPGRPPAGGERDGGRVWGILETEEWSVPEGGWVGGSKRRRHADAVSDRMKRFWGRFGPGEVRWKPHWDRLKPHPNRMRFVDYQRLNRISG